MIRNNVSEEGMCGRRGGRETKHRIKLKIKR
jgi:hypothetical protein